MTIFKSADEYARELLESAQGGYFEALRLSYMAAQKYTTLPPRFWADVVISLNELCNVGKD